MDVEKQIEQARYLMDRYDRLIQAVDLKGNIIAIYNFTIIGALVFNYNQLKEALNFSMDSTALFFWIVLVFIIISLISLYFVILAIFPFLESKNKKGKSHKSLIFFKTIYQMGQKDFESAFSDQGNEELLADFKAQLYNLAKALTLKFENIRKAGVICYVHLLLCVILIFMKLA